MYVNRVLVALFAVLFAVSAAYGQDDDLDFASMDLEDLLNVEVTVASKSSETVADAPSSVTVFSRQEIINLGVRTLEDLLNYVPGFQTARSGEVGTLTAGPSARGRRTDLAGPDVLLLIDGMRYNNSWRGGAFNVSNNITLFNVKQVEIIRGPGSALYGSNAFLGVINIVTQTEKNEGFFGLGSFDSREGYVNVNREVGDGITTSFSARGYSDAGDDYQLPPFGDTDGQTTDPIDELDIYATVQRKDKWRINMRYAKRRQEDFEQFGAIANGINYSNEKATSITGAYYPVNNEVWQVKLFGGYLKNEEDFLEAFFARGVAQAVGIFTSEDPALGGTVMDEEQYMMAFDASWNMNSKNTLSFGSSFRRASINKIRLQNNFDANDLFSGNLPTPVFTDIREGFILGREGDREVLGIYVQDKFRFTDRFSLTVGARYDDYDDFGSSINPRGAIIYKPGTSVFKLMYGRAFRAPTIRELTNLDLSFQSNPDLNPEEVSTLELAWVQKIGRAQITATYYDATIDDGVALVDIGAGTGFQVLQPQNTSEIDLSGFELEFAVPVGNMVVIKGNYTVMNDVVENPQLIADTLASFFININPRRFNINLNGFYHDQVESGSGAILDSFWHFNATFGYQISEGFRFYARGNNIFNEDYNTVSTITLQLPNGIPARGAGYLVGAEVRF